ncbi:MAG: hypothetical protein J7513_05015 [Solirubrobacteraceae bacterium]|nr:hypothetical protein [Solirubrobacteraceae bacterium]
MLRRSLPLRPAAALAVVLVAGLTLAACGGPRKSDSKTIDAIIIDRGALIGAKGDAPPGVRALNTGVAKNLGQLENEVHHTLFGDGGKVSLFGYLNGIKPKGGQDERAYPGDRTGWLQRDVSDPAAVPGAVVGLFPAPFTTRFTPKRRLMPTRVQCADGESNGCKATLDSLAKAGVRTGISGLQDATATTALRVYVGTWAALRPVLGKNRLKTALEVEQEPERNGFGLQISADGKSVVEGAIFGEMADTGTFGAGTGVVFATRDILGNTFWVVTGTDDEGVTRAAEAISENDLDGRVAAIAPPR